MKKDTLRTIMLSVLEKNSRSMYPNDLAEVIRTDGLYTQKDGTPLKNGHIHAMVANYPNLFIKIDGKVTVNDGIIAVCKTDNLLLKFRDIEDFDSNPMEDWFHESKLCATLVTYFEVNGYEIKKSNAQNKSAKGMDIVVLKDGTLEFIEVKGYPSIYYVEEKKRNEIKKTKPYLQSSHWFSGCLSSTLNNYESKEIKLAMAFPACSRYEKLVMNSQKYFTDNNLDIKVYFVDEKGGVTISNLNENLIVT